MIKELFYPFSHKTKQHHWIESVTMSQEEIGLMNESLKFAGIFYQGPTHSFFEYPACRIFLDGVFDGNDVVIVFEKTMGNTSGIKVIDKNLFESGCLNIN